MFPMPKVKVAQFRGFARFLLRSSSSYFRMTESALVDLYVHHFSFESEPCCFSHIDQGPRSYRTHRAERVIALLVASGFLKRDSGYFVPGPEWEVVHGEAAQW